MRDLRARPSAYVLLVAAATAVGFALRTAAAVIRPVPEHAEDVAFPHGVAYFLLETILLVVVAGAAILVSEAMHRGERPAPGLLLARMRSRAGSLLGTGLVVLLPARVLMAAAPVTEEFSMALLGYVVAATVAAVLFSAWCLALPASLLERRRVGGNVDRSIRLTDRSLGRVFLALLPALLVAAGGASLASLAPWAVDLGPLHLGVGDAAGVLARLLAVTLLGAILAALYRDAVAETEPPRAADDSAAGAPAGAP